MEKLSVSKFKSTCLSVLDNVNKQKKRVIITKRGKPIAEVIPYDPVKNEISLKDSVKFIEDIISPVAEDDWEVIR